MTRAAGVVLVLVLSGCDLNGGGGGAGGGGGGNNVVFNSGWVFVRKDDRNLYVADSSDLQTTARLTTTGGCRQPSLSKDAKRVVFVRAAGAGTEIATVASTGGATSTVFTSSSTVTNLRTPVFSADGQSILFAYDSGASSSLGTVKLDGSGFAQAAGGSALSYASPSLLPDGVSVLAASGSSGTSLLQIEKVNTATGASQNIASSLGLEAQSIINRIVASPDGTKAVFDGRVSSGASRIFVIDLTSKVVSRITDYPADPNASDSFPTWVGNTQVGFSSDTGGNDQLYVLPANAMSTSGGLQVPSAIEGWFGPN